MSEEGITVSVECRGEIIATFYSQQVPSHGDVLNINELGVPLNTDNIYVVSPVSPLWRIVGTHVRTVFITVEKVEDK